MPIASAELELVLPAILVGVGALLVLAGRLGVPYPILLVGGGALLALVPGVPEVALEPDLVLVLFLPPLLYAAAFFTSLAEVRRAARPIGLLAIGAVAATVLAVAALGHWVLGLTWEAAFVLGAVLGPTDPVAATAIAGRLGAPRRFVTIVEGESLINDAVALIAYRFAVTAAVSGTFSLADAALELVLAAVGGVAVGALVGAAVTAVRQRLDDAPTEIAVSFIAPYVAYLPAEAVGASAVLAAVTTGIWLGWHAPRIVSPTTRIQAFGTWEVLVFVLNAVLFVLVGLQLPVVVAGLEGEPAALLLRDALLVTALVVAVRFAWVMGVVGSGPRARHEPPRNRRVQVLVAFTGLRGAVSLAAALAVPEGVPGRDRLVFLAYVVVFATVVGQGLALPWIIGRLGLRGTEEERARLETEARRAAARAALERLDALRDEPWVDPETADRLHATYAFRLRRFGGEDPAAEDRSRSFQRLRREALDAERAALLRLRDDGAIDDEVRRVIERDLDLEDARLDLPRAGPG